MVTQRTLRRRELRERRARAEEEFYRKLSTPVTVAIASRPLHEGDRVQMREQPWLRGTVWSLDALDPDKITVKWDSPDENAYVRPERLIRLRSSPARRPRRALRP